ncbi:hypothetical protein LWE61_09020 [Sphingobium sufflavum]|uniref:hypothetical protein n=1 Tax=Sphingobium sufflavum TaxID=1129547 RepID=UPI001F20596C|nr:hypothetical protein [Sphingobium sufflavum]MCE7796700.1 hypothetical protein [Sphingobium sufflavum]
MLAYPTGTTGIELGFGPYCWEIGWGYQGAGDARDAANADYTEKRDALQSVADGNGAGARPKKLAGGTRAARARWKSANKDATKARTAARADIKRLRPPPTSRLSGDYWGKEEDDGLDLTVLVNDRAIGWSELKQQYKSAATALKCVNDILHFSKGIKDNLMLAFAFLNDYSPSIVRPSASLSLEVMTIDLFLGHKLTGSDSLKGDRWRALQPYWDVEVAAKLLEISGSIGVTVGRSLLGTGASVELSVTATGTATVAYEAKGRSLAFPPAGFEHELKAIGTITLSSTLIGKATFLWFEVGAAGGAAAGGGVRWLGSCEPRNLLDFGQWDKRLLGDPIVATIFYRSAFSKNKTKQYVLWGGTSPKDDASG